jgi:hypothetical protein
MMAMAIIAGSIAYFLERKSFQQQFQKIESSYIDFIRPALWVKD